MQTSSSGLCSHAWARLRQTEESTKNRRARRCPRSVTNLAEKIVPKTKYSAEGFLAQELEDRLLNYWDAHIVNYFINENVTISNDAERQNVERMLEFAKATY